MRLTIIAWLLMVWVSVSAQTSVGLVAYYTFENSAADVTGNTANGGLASGTPGYTCGVRGNAIQFRGGEDALRFLGPVKGEFDTEDFTVSLYFKSVGAGGVQYLVSKRDMACSANNQFYIRYAPAAGTVNVLITETPNKSASWVYRVDPTACWHHVAVARQGGQIRFYYNGERQQQSLQASRINITNNGDLLLGTSDCLSASESSFRGLMDEFRVYNRALDDREVRALYFAPDRILSQDTLIYLGESVPITLTGTCASGFSWQPQAGVANPLSGQTTISPQEAGIFTYRLRLSDDLSTCVSSDTIRITVIDPNELDCNSIYMPAAFTPNGDGLNDEYGISNPFAVQDLQAFEVYDRWGGRMFYTEDPFAKWDGMFSGSPVGPGVYLYRLLFRCNGVDQVRTGSITILR